MSEQFDLLRRRLLSTGVPAGLLLGAAAGWPEAAVAQPQVQRVRGSIDVTEYGAVGDGVTPSASAFQQALDAAEANGGGVVTVPPGVFVLEFTPLIGSRVRLRGAGAASVLRGDRPKGQEGAALISNKGQQARGYGGAHDWGISHLAIDSPLTNGIVVTRAARVYIAHIYGIDVFNHFVDIVGRDVLCEYLWLTGRSGTSTFQIDSLSGAQTIWDGERAVAPRYDDTDSRDVVLRNSVITAVAGHQGNQPRHDVSVHFHGDDTAGFIFSDLILGGATTGFYQDADTRYDNIQIANVRSHNPGAAIVLNPGRSDQRGLSINGLMHVPEHTAGRPYRGVDIHGRRDVSISQVQLVAPADSDCEFALRLTGCRRALVHGIQAVASGGRGILVADANEASPADAAQVLIESCMLEGFEVGCEYSGDVQTAVHAHRNLFSNVESDYLGPMLGDSRSD